MNHRELYYEIASFTGGEYLFWEKDQMYITKPNKEGFWCTSEAMKDPNYKGNKYIWKIELEK